MTSLRIATFNLENLDVRPGQTRPLPERVSALRPQLIRLAADILCLQEVNAQTCGPHRPRRLAALDRLLEDILDPNRNVDQAFRLTRLDLKNGLVVEGLLLREEGEVYVMADNQGKEVRVEKSKVDERTIQQRSPMPDNFVDQVSEADFNNLIAFLLKQQAAKEEKPKEK